MKKSTLYNYLIIILAIILVVSISVKFFTMEESDLKFTGPNIYRAVYVYDAVNQQGYAVNLSFDGKWTDSGQKVSGSGRALSSGLGYFLIDFNGNQITLGGPLTAKEDISMKSFSLIPLHKEVVKIGLEPLSYVNLNEMHSELLDVSYASAGSDNLYNSGIEGTIMLDTNTILYPTLVQKIENRVVSDLDIELFDRGLYIYFENADIECIKSVSEVLESENIGVTAVATGRITVFARAKNSVSLDREEIIDVLEDFGLESFAVTIIRKPLK